MLVNPQITGFIYTHQEILNNNKNYCVYTQNDINYYGLIVCDENENIKLIRTYKDDEIQGLTYKEIISSIYDISNKNNKYEYRINRTVTRIRLVTDDFVLAKLSICYILANDIKLTDDKTKLQTDIKYFKKLLGFLLIREKIL